MNVLKNCRHVCCAQANEHEKLFNFAYNSDRNKSRNCYLEKGKKKPKGSQVAGFVHASGTN
jgi:hypothetical protein